MHFGINRVPECNKVSSKIDVIGFHDVGHSHEDIMIEVCEVSWLMRSRMCLQRHTESVVCELYSFWLKLVSCRSLQCIRASKLQRENHERHLTAVRYCAVACGYQTRFPWNVPMTVVIGTNDFSGIRLQCCKLGVLCAWSLHWLTVIPMVTAESPRDLSWAFKGSSLSTPLALLRYSTISVRIFGTFSKSPFLTLNSVWYCLGSCVLAEFQLHLWKACHAQKGRL